MLQWSTQQFDLWTFHGLSECAKAPFIRWSTCAENDGHAAYQCINKGNDSFAEVFETRRGDNIIAVFHDLNGPEFALKDGELSIQHVNRLGLLTVQENNVVHVHSTGKVCESTEVRNITLWLYKTWRKLWCMWRCNLLWQICFADLVKETVEVPISAHGKIRHVSGMCVAKEIFSFKKKWHQIIDSYAGNL